MTNPINIKTLQLLEGSEEVNMCANGNCGNCGCGDNCQCGNKCGC